MTIDPGFDDPSLLSDARVNDFEFAEADGDGRLVPHAAHIRKTYPRDDDTEDGGEEDTQTHRLLRRGIPYGPSFDVTDPVSGSVDRGLLFLCYQTSIARQFEHVQRRWVTTPTTLAPAPGTTQ